MDGSNSRCWSTGSGLFRWTTDIDGRRGELSWMAVPEREAKEDVEGGAVGLEERRKEEGQNVVQPFLE